MRNNLIQVNEQLVLKSRSFRDENFQYTIRDTETSTENLGKVLSSYKGKIIELLFAIPGGFTSETTYWNPYKSIIAQFENTKIHILFQNLNDKEKVETEFDSHDINFIEVSPFIKFTDWVQDPFIVVPDNNGFSIIEPYNFKRNFDMSLGSNLGVTRAHFPIMFEGGNILVGDEDILIGFDSFINTNKLHNKFELLTNIGDNKLIDIFYHFYSKMFSSNNNPLKLVRSFEYYINKQDTNEIEHGSYIVNDQFYAGNEEGTSQPIFHIDMFITYFGEKKVLIGDPLMHTDLFTIPTNFPLPTNYNWITMSDVFNEIAEFLRLQNYTVKRCPMPLMCIESVGNSSNKINRDWFFASYNNCIVENYKNDADEHIKRVLLPTYGHDDSLNDWKEALEQLDIKVQEIWQDLDYEVIPLGNFKPFAERLGGPHCLIKPLIRK